MRPLELLRPEEIAALRIVLIDKGLIEKTNRKLLVSGIPPALRLRLPYHARPDEQLDSDLLHLNAQVGIDDPPLAIWLDRVAVCLAQIPVDVDFSGYAAIARERNRDISARDGFAHWRVFARDSIPSSLPPAAADPQRDAVRLEPRAIEPAEGTPPPAPSPGTLAELLTRPALSGRPIRWAILGEPGSGKSTLARDLVRRLCTGELPPDTPVPVLLTFAQIEKAHDPFKVADALYEAATGFASGLAARFWKLAEQPGRLYLLLDGFDEVPTAQRADAIEKLEHWHRRLPHVSIAVFSRPVGWADGLNRIYHAVDIPPLNPEQQRHLLRARLGDAGEALLRRIAARPALTELAQNPFLLTLLARLSQDRTLPPTRIAVYDQAITDLLTRGIADHSAPPEARSGVRCRATARRLLDAFSLALTEDGAAGWSKDDLIYRLHLVYDADPLLGRHCQRVWCHPAEALEDIAHNSGVLAPHDGPDAPWRYLHRSLRERLAAGALAAAGPDALLTRVRTLTAAGGKLDADRLAQWGETLGMACALLPEPETAIKEIRKHSPLLALRVLPEVETLSAEAALAVIETIKPAKGHTWDGDTLVRVLRDRPGAEDVLWARVKRATDLDRLAWIHYALTALTGRVDDNDFFKAAKRPRPDVRPIVYKDATDAPRAGLTLVKIPIGPFTRGEGNTAHPVLLTRPYALGVVPVTSAEYRRFDPAHKCPGDKESDGDQRPVTEVSWWRARLYAAWVGCRLPTEAEWEKACRAGTTTRFWSGDTDAQGEEAGWSNAQLAEVAYPVAKKPDNDYGLYDMHGNVYEWMADWHAPYPTSHSLPLVDPAGPPKGISRVLRGGAFTEPAKNNTAARRSRWQPRFTSSNTGFRLARDVQPAPDPTGDHRGPAQPGSPAAR